jgi:transcriptional regulator with XRE-family HTH domain
MSDQVQQIAMRVKELREISGFGVSEVASKTGVSEEEYSAYESGRADLPISLLLKLSELYGVDTTTLLTGQAPRLSVCALTRKNMGVPIERAEHYIYKNLAYNFNHRKIEPLLVTVTPDANREMVTNAHPGHEFDYILEGSMRLKVGEQEMIMNEGDSAYYDSMHPHAMQAVGDQKCVFLAMVIP